MHSGICFLIIYLCKTGDAFQDIFIVYFRNTVDVFQDNFLLSISIEKAFQDNFHFRTLQYDLFSFFILCLCITEDAFLDNFPHWYPLCAHDDSKGIELPQPTVLPPQPSSRVQTGSPRAQSKDRVQKSVQNVSQTRFISMLRRKLLYLSNSMCEYITMKSTSTTATTTSTY